MQKWIITMKKTELADKYREINHGFPEYHRHKGDLVKAGYT